MVFLKPKVAIAEVRPLLKRWMFIRYSTICLCKSLSLNERKSQKSCVAGEVEGVKHLFGVAHNGYRLPSDVD